ncbi:MAG: TonB family protein [Elusimicrobiaceae bacterium]|nr:TonB family protein [Elusimicrobiaceae bacterium]
MNWYLVYSGGLHALAALLILFLVAPGVQKPSATYTIDFIGNGKVQAVTAPSAPKTEVKAPAPAQEAIARPEPAAKVNKKAYVSKTEIAAKKQQTKKPAPAPAALEAPSVLEDEPTTAGEGDFNGGNITTDFANFPYPWYITQVRNSLWIEWEKRRPAGSELSTLVSFAIARDGKIKNLKVQRSSNDDTFDFAATSAVINAGPFAPLPMYYEKDELTVSVEFKQEK